MRELGHRGGKARRQGVAEQLPEAERQSLRQYLRDSLDHETIKGAVEQALAGGNESARVACIKFLSDLELYRKDGDEEDRARQMAKAGAEAREHIAAQLNRRARVHEREEVRALLDELAAQLRIEADAANPDLSTTLVSSERAAAILRGLEEVGLVVRRGTLEEMAEQMAQERLQALREEHGIPA